MKKIMKNNRIIVFALMTVFMSATTTAIMANDKNPASQVVLKYIGKTNNNPVFELAVNADGGQNEFLVVIRDEAGMALYTENIKSGSFTKKFQLNAEELADAKLRFEITSRSTNEKTVYEINRFTKVVEDMSIMQINK